MSKPSIAIIGGGPAGCALLKSFEAANKLSEYDITVFEKQEKLGGLWNFDWHTGIDQNGEVVHGSMYKYLWSNGPKECLEFSDFTMEQHFGKKLPSYPPRPVMEEYLRARYETEENMKRFRFETVVRYVNFEEDTQKFKVVSHDLKTRTDKVEHYDYVAVATGHYNRPSMPHYPGFESFQGRLIHAHDFKDGSQYKDKVVMTIGSSYSAEDIASQCAKYGASKLLLCAREKAADCAWYHYNWPEEKFEMKPILTHIEGKTVHFKDGTSEVVDAIIVCTGYRHYYPFMEESLRLQSPDLLYPGNLYKNVFWENNPKCMYIGAFHQWFTYPMFEAQSWYARDVILGRIALPDAEGMKKDSKVWMDKESNLPSEESTIDFQSEHIQMYVDATDYELNVPVCQKNFHDFVANKKVDIMKFRDLSHIDPTDGKPSPAPTNGTWMDRLDDTTKTFLENC